MERTKTLLSCLTDKCFPPASSLSPKASGLVLSVSLSRVSQPVYNIEVHGEHVYQVGELGLVVHIDDVANLFASTPGHVGTHTLALVDCLIDVMIDRHSTESMISYPVSFGF